MNRAGARGGRAVCDIQDITRNGQTMRKIERAYGNRWRAAECGEAISLDNAGTGAGSRL